MREERRVSGRAKRGAFGERCDVGGGIFSGFGEFCGKI